MKNNGVCGWLWALGLFVGILLGVVLSKSFEIQTKKLIEQSCPQNIEKK